MALYSVKREEYRWMKIGRPACVCLCVDRAVLRAESTKALTRLGALLIPFLMGADWE